MPVRVLSFSLLASVALLATPSSAVSINWVFVGDPGNAPDTASNCSGANCGSVLYEYYISKYEVTNAQYAEFLRAAAASDPLGLYDHNMGLADGGITRGGSDGSYSYAVKPAFENKPVNFVSFYDALRFTNWLHNGEGSGDTETGAYTITTSGISNNTITRNPGANVFLPSENEWYKAAYFDGMSYFDYPAGSSARTVCSAPTGAANSANCDFPEFLPYVTDVGSYTSSASPYGTFDQGGNVAEWNEQVGWRSIQDVRGVRGGSYFGGADFLAASNPDFDSPTDGGAFIGFRAASLVPEPGTVALVMTGLAGLSLRRKRFAKAL